jgi:uncharacterized protein (TIGR03437 family)
LAALAQAPDWRQVGGSSVELMLAAPATGPVDSVWFSADGTTLYARTASGRVFRTSDFETWAPFQTVAEPVSLMDAIPARAPETGARIVTAAFRPGRLYALGRNLFRSDDGGQTWANLTALRSMAVIGSGQRSVAISQTNPDHLVVANGYGVWRSMDGGMSWSGLNQFLPNLRIRRILSTPAGATGTRVLADRMGALELAPGSSVWSRSGAADLENEAALMGRFSALLNAEITAAGFSEDRQTVYAGSADGRLWVSTNRGEQFLETDTPTGTSGRVARIHTDPSGELALAVLDGEGPRVLRITNRRFWDKLDGDLPNTPVRGITADRATGAVYVATDKGIYWTATDLQNPSVNPVTWTSLSEGVLPEFPATDVRLDPAGVQLYAALDGYGIYAVAAPHRTRNIRIINTADFSTRAAAPGSLLSVVGGRVDAVRGGNLNYPVLQVLGNESQVQVPFEAVGPSVGLSLQIGGRVLRRELPVLPVSPAIMLGRDGAPMLYDADTGLPIDPRNPAHASGRIQIWLTGLGRVRPDWPTGMAAPLDNPPSVAASVRVFLDGTPLEVTRATLLPGYIGFYLVEAQLPSITNVGTAQLHVTAEGQESNRVILVIEP